MHTSSFWIPAFAGMTILNWNNGLRLKKNPAAASGRGGVFCCERRSGLAVCVRLFFVRRRGLRLGRLGLMRDLRFRCVVLHRLRCGRRGRALLARDLDFRMLNRFRVLRRGFHRRGAFNLLMFHRPGFGMSSVGQVHFALYRRCRVHMRRFLH